MGLFADRDFGSVSIRDIGKAAGVNSAMIYYHFRNKRDLYRAAIESAVDEAFELFAEHCNAERHETPAEAIGGLRFLKALSAPFRDVRFVPTGGVNASNLADYLRMPQVIACGGSWMVSPPLIAQRQFDRVETLTREALEIVADVRGG